MGSENKKGVGEMKRVMLEVDWYMKVVLTLIAVLLAGILVKPYLVTKPGVAQSTLADPERWTGIGKRAAEAERKQEEEFLREEVGRYQLVSFPKKGSYPDFFGTIDTKTGIFMLWSDQLAARFLRKHYKRGSMEAWYVGDHITGLNSFVEVLLGEVLTEEGEDSASGKK